MGSVISTISGSHGTCSEIIGHWLILEGINHVLGHSSLSRSALEGLEKILVSEFFFGTISKLNKHPPSAPSTNFLFNTANSPLNTRHTQSLTKVQNQRTPLTPILTVI